MWRDKTGCARGPHDITSNQTVLFLSARKFLSCIFGTGGRQAKRMAHTHMELVNNPSMVIVPPGVVHGYKCIGEKTPTL